MNPARKISACCIAPAILLAGIAAVVSKPVKPVKEEARVTQIIKEVELLPANATPRPAMQDDKVSSDTGVRTGDESRSELTFEDLTITRLGANTVFSFNKAGRNGQLDSGSILLRVPKNSGGAEFRTRAVTVGITGTTVIFESTRLGNSKLIALEGAARLHLNKYPAEVANIQAGQMLDVKAGAIKVPPPSNVDLDQIMRTHPLITDFPPLPSQKLISTAIKNQQIAPAGPPALPPASAGNPPPPPPPGGGATAAPIVNSTPVPPRTPRPKRTPRPIVNVNTTPTPQPASPQTPTPKPTGLKPPRPKRPPVSGVSNATPTPTPPPLILKQGPLAGGQKASQGNVRGNAQANAQATPTPRRNTNIFKKFAPPKPTPPIVR